MFRQSFLKNRIYLKRSNFFLNDEKAINEIYNKLNSENIKAFLKLAANNKCISLQIKKLSKVLTKIGGFIREFDEINRGYAEFEKACIKYDNMVASYRRILKNIPENWDPLLQQYSHDNSLTYHQTEEGFNDMKNQMWPPKVWGYETCETLRDGERPRVVRIKLSEVWDDRIPQGMSAETVRRNKLDRLYADLPTLIQETSDIVSLLDKNDDIINALPAQAFMLKKAFEEIKEIALQFSQMNMKKDNNLSETREFR